MKEINTMMFCPKCGSLLKVKKEKNKTIQFCSCGYTSEQKKPQTIKETIDSEEKKIEVVEDQNVNPLTEEICPKCGHNKAYWWMKQTKAGDEADTKF